jgi:membrane-associated phospholipid phosphatase
MAGPKQIRVVQRRELTAAERADIKVAKAAALPPGSTISDSAKAFGSLGDQPPMAAACATILGCGLAFRDQRMARAGLRMFAALGLATAIKKLVKDNVDRTRPGEVFENGRYRLSDGKSKDKHLRSMPSGHSAGAMAVLRAAAREYPGAAMPLNATALAIAGAQLPTRHHFLTDIVAGAGVGAVSEKLVAVAFDWIEAEIAT